MISSPFNHSLWVVGIVWVGSKSTLRRLSPLFTYAVIRSCCIFFWISRLIIDARVFLAEARLILAKMVWNFDLELVNPNDSTWLNQKAYLVFEPKSLMVKLKEKTLV